MSEDTTTVRRNKPRKRAMKIDYSNEKISTTRDSVTDELFEQIHDLVNRMNIDLCDHGLGTITTDELGIAFISMIYDVALDEVAEEGEVSE